MSAGKKSGAGKVKMARAVKPPKLVKEPKKYKQFWLQVGTPNEMGAARSYATDASARNALRKELRDWKEWQARYNQAGLQATRDALEWANIVGFTNEPIEYIVLLDDYSGMAMRIKLWKTQSQPVEDF